MSVISAVSAPFTVIPKEDTSQLLFPFVPQSDYVESLEFLTDVIRTKNGEQRINLRTFPRRSYRYTFILKPDEYAFARLISARSNEPFRVPLWGDKLHIGDVVAGATSAPAYHPTVISRRHFGIGQSILIWESWRRYETRVISSIDENGIIYFSPTLRGYTNAVIVPLRKGRISQPLSATRRAGPDVIAEITFSTNESYGTLTRYIAYPSYLGLPVITSEIAAGATITDVTLREVETFDNGTGEVWTAPAYLASSHVSTMSWDFIERDKFWDVYAWLLDQRGKWKGFFLPSRNADFELASPVASNATAIQVRNTGIPREYLPTPAHLFIETSNGGHVFRTIANFAKGAGDNPDTLHLDEAYGSIFQPNRMHLMTPVRFDADRVEMHFTSGGYVRFSIPIRQIPNLGR